MLITETSPRADLEMAALDLGLADTSAQCDAIGAMSDQALYAAILTAMELGNEAAP